MDYGKTFGRKQERQVIQTLFDSGYKVNPPTKREDIYLDIDAWVNQLPISIKSLTPKSVNTFGRIVLEHKVKLHNGDWQDSWFKYGHSHGYLFLLNNSLWYADKQKLNKFVDKYQDDEDAITWKQLARETQLKQIEKGHPHINSFNANVKINKLVEEDVLQYCGELGGSVWIPIHSRTNTETQLMRNGT